MLDSPELKGIFAGILFIIIVISLFFSIFEEQYTEAMVLTIVAFAMYFAASGKLKKFKGLGIELEFLKQKHIIEHEEPILSSIKVSGEDLSFEEKMGRDHLRQILPFMQREHYTCLVIRKGIHVDRETLRFYLQELLQYDFFKHVIFVDDKRKYVAHILASSLYRKLLPVSENMRHDELSKETISLINQWNVGKIPDIVVDKIETGTDYYKALQKMKATNITYLPIIDEKNQFKGIITKEEILDEIVKTVKLPQE